MYKVIQLLLFFSFFQIEAYEFPRDNHPLGVLATDERLEELGEELLMPPISESGLVKTLNHGGGFMLVHPDSVSNLFINFASTCTLPVLDIGAAFGVTTIPSLKNSSSLVIANDISADNLLVLRKQVEEKDRGRLYLNTARFPEELNFPKESLEAVLICRVIHFLRGEEIEEGLSKIHQWLIPGGKLFIVTSTQYQNNLIDFVSLYEERWSSGNRWPGYVEDYGLNAPGLSHNLHPFLNVMDERPLRRALEDSGFVIQEVHVIDRRKTIPTTSLDGREGIGIVAVKN